MDIKTETMTTETNENAEPGEQIGQRKRLEKRWFWIALLPLIAIYYNISATSVYFEVAAGLHDTWILSLGHVLTGLALFLVPLLLNRLGVLGDFRKFRVAFTVALLVGTASFVGFSVVTSVIAAPPAVLCACLYYISTIAHAIAAGCALHRAVKVMSPKSAAMLSGLTMIVISVLATLHLLYLEIVGDWVVSFTVLYAVFSFVPLILLFMSKDNFEYAAPKRAAYFSEALFTKFMIAAVLMTLMDTFSDSGYYAGGDIDNILNAWLQMAAVFLPAISGCVVALLLRKNKWLPVMAAVALLICFQQGLILFFSDNYPLAVSYAFASYASGSGPGIFLIFIPLMLCIQRRDNAAAVTGMVAAWFLLYAVVVATQAEQAVALSPIVTPAVTFTLSLAAIAYLFYLHGENNRVYVASLIAEFKAREIEDVQETVSAADKLEGLGLAPREREVCVLLLKSMSVKQIAVEMHLAFGTVNTYYRSLYRKLGISSKGELFMRFGAEAPAELASELNEG
jgi:DNA-binding CsgD family transcriptional regulator